jgi:hypothetical protein
MQQVPYDELGAFVIRIPLYDVFETTSAVRRNDDSERDHMNYFQGTEAWNLAKARIGLRRSCVVPDSKLSTI